MTDPPTSKVHELYLEVDTVPVTMTTHDDNTINVRIGRDLTISGPVALRLLISFIEAGLEAIDHGKPQP